MRAGSVVVRKGDKITKGQKIGVMGNTGDCKSSRMDIPPEYRGTHLHIGIKENSTYYNNGDWSDPLDYLTGVKIIGGKTAVTQPKAGDPLGDVLYSDITAYINGYAIPTSIADNKTLVVAEDLARYGFDVIWDGNARTLNIERNTNKAFNPLPAEILPANKASGDVRCKYVYTDIKTYLSGELAASYAINGLTLIDVELLAKYGKVSWDGRARELIIVLV